MSEQFLGEIRQFGFTFPPQGWAFCQGQILGISQNAALFSLIGTYYGGNGTSNFALPNLQNNIPIGQGALAGGSTYVMGETGGATSVSITSSTTPNHSHSIGATASAGRDTTPISTSVLGDPQRGYAPPYNSTTNSTSLAAASVGTYGGSTPHNNIMPTLGINFCISLVGIFPSRS